MWPVADEPAPALPPPPGRPRRARASGRRPRFDRAAVVEAALRVLDAEGLDAVTIRRVAQELGTSPAGIYTYVTDKEELVDLLLDRVLAEFDYGVIDPAGPWQDQVRAFAGEGRRVFTAHADSARAALGRIPHGEHALRASDTLIGILDGAGLPPLVTSYAVDLLSLYVTSTAYEQGLMTAQGLHAENIERFVLELRRYFEALPADRFPHVVAHAATLTASEDEGGDRFAFGLDVLLAGIAALAERRSGGA
jgi:AcrR family transcriptional regulator